MRKSVHQRTITGTLGGVSEHTGIDYTWLRICFVLLIFITKGLAVLLYLALFIAMPKKKEMQNYSPNFLRHHLNYYAKRFKWDFKDIISDHLFRRIFGFAFLLLGFYWLQKDFNLWTILLLVLGAALILKPRGLLRGYKNRQTSSGWSNLAQNNPRPN